MYDNSDEESRLLAFGNQTGRTILDGDTWLDVLRSAGYDDRDEFEIAG